MAQFGSARVAPTFGVGKAFRAAPLRTEPTRALRWKRAISFPLCVVWGALFSIGLLANCLEGVLWNGDKESF